MTKRDLLDIALPVAIVLVVGVVVLFLVPRGW